MIMHISSLIINWRSNGKYMKGEFETHYMFMNQIFFTINLKEGEKEDNSNLVNKLVRSC
jgi:hypothetical protein